MNEWGKGGEDGGGTVALERFSRIFHFLGLSFLRCIDEDKSSIIHLFIYHTPICFNIYPRTVVMVYNFAAHV